MALFLNLKIMHKDAFCKESIFALAFKNQLKQTIDSYNQVKRAVCDLSHSVMQLVIRSPFKFI